MRNPLFLALSLAFLPALAHAAPDPDSLVEGAKQCTRFLPRYERQYGIPVHLLSAISSVESGRWHDGLKLQLPWPWTINADGKSYYYNSKAEAVNAAHQLLAQGAKNTDIGCMQVSVQQHPKAFSSLEEAFDPEHNVAYASTFLRSLYDEKKNWHAAAAAYHSRTPVFGSEYAGHVYDRWNAILDRVRESRLNLARSMGGVASGGGLTVAENASAKEAAHASHASMGTQPVALNKPNKDKAEKKQADNGLLMRPKEQIRPTVASVTVPPVVVQPQQPNVKLADAQGMNAMAPAAGQADAHVVRVSAPGPMIPAQQAQAGPRFIFND